MNAETLRKIMVAGEVIARLNRCQHPKVVNGRCPYCWAHVKQEPHP